MVTTSTVSNQQSLWPASRSASSRMLPQHPPHTYRLYPLIAIALMWVLLVVVNYLTGRHLRFEFSMLLWISANVLMLFTSKGMYQIFLLLLLPTVTMGVTEYFGISGATVEMAFLIPAINLLPYCLLGNLRNNYPARNLGSRQHPLIPQLALFLIVCFASALPGHVHYPTQAIRAIGVIFVIPFLFYLYSVHAISRLANIKEVATVIVVMAGWYSAMAGLMQLAARSSFAKLLRNMVFYPPEKIQNMWEFTWKEGKIISMWPDAASFGHVLNFSFPLALGLMLTARTPRKRLFFLVTLGLIASGILISGNRTDLVGGLVTIVILVASFWQRSVRFRLFMMKSLLLFLIVVSAVMVTRENNSLRRLINPSDWDRQTASSRVILINEGIRMLKQSPAIGIGLDNFRFNQDYRQGGHYIKENYAHNLFIQILAETGVLGLGTFLILMASVFLMAGVIWRNRTRTELDFFCFLFLVSCVVLLLQGLAENSLFYVQTSALFWTGVGIWRGRAIDLSHRR